MKFLILHPYHVPHWYSLLLIGSVMLLTEPQRGLAQTEQMQPSSAPQDPVPLSPASPAAEVPHLVAPVPDRDLEVRLHYPELGPSLALYLTDQLSIQAGFGSKFFTNYSFLEPYLETGGEDIVNWVVGYTAVFSAGLAYDFPIKAGLFTPKDTFDLRVAARIRGLVIAKVDGVDYLPTIGEAGVAVSFPITAGATWTYWVLPDSRRGLKTVSRLTDLGLFARMELGPDFITYYVYQVDGQSAEPVQVPRIELLYNFSIGVVL